MHDEQKALRQLKAAIRLRTLQREKAELQWRYALQQLRLAQQALQTETTLYYRVLAQHRQFIGQGVALHLALQEQRWRALADRRIAVAGRQQAIVDARELFQAAKVALVQAKVGADVTNKAWQRVAVTVAHQAQDKELIDIFDAQYRQGGSHGA